MFSLWLQKNYRRDEHWNSFTNHFEFIKGNIQQVSLSLRCKLILPRRLESPFTLSPSIKYYPKFLSLLWCVSEILNGFNCLSVSLLLKKVKIVCTSVSFSVIWKRICTVWFLKLHNIYKCNRKKIGLKFSETNFEWKFQNQRTGLFYLLQNYIFAGFFKAIVVFSQNIPGNLLTSWLVSIDLDCLFCWYFPLCLKQSNCAKLYLWICHQNTCKVS